MRKSISGSTWRRGMAIALLVIGMLPLSARADLPPLSQKDLHLYNRVIFGLLQAGKAPGDVADFALNYRLCQQLQGPGSDRPACIRLAGAKVGITSSSDVNVYAGVYGYFSVYDGFLKTTGGMNVNYVSSGYLHGTRTDPQGGRADFDFYPGNAGEDFVDFTYKTAIDSGTGFVYWVTDCMLVGTFISDQLSDGKGKYNSGLIVMRRCVF